MYEDNLLAGKGLKLLFVSQILSVISNFMAEGVLSGVVELASVIVALVGLNIAAPVHPYFRSAFRLNIALIVLYVVTMVLTARPNVGLSIGQIVLMLALAISAVVLGLGNVYLICTAAGALLTANGYAALAAKGATVWKIVLICSVTIIICVLLLVVPFIQIIAAILAVGTTIAMLVGAILYMVFLYNAYHALLYGQ